MAMFPHVRQQCSYVRASKGCTPSSSFCYAVTSSCKASCQPALKIYGLTPEATMVWPSVWAILFVNIMGIDAYDACHTCEFHIQVLLQLADIMPDLQPAAACTEMHAPGMLHHYHQCVIMQSYLYSIVKLGYVHCECLSLEGIMTSIYAFSSGTEAALQRQPPKSRSPTSA